MATSDDMNYALRRFGKDPMAYATDRYAPVAREAATPDTPIDRSWLEKTGESVFQRVRGTDDLLASVGNLVTGDREGAIKRIEAWDANEQKARAIGPDAQEFSDIKDVQSGASVFGYQVANMLPDLAFGGLLGGAVKGVVKKGATEALTTSLTRKLLSQPAVLAAEKKAQDAAVREVRKTMAYKALGNRVEERAAKKAAREQAGNQFVDDIQSGAKLAAAQSPLVRKAGTAGFAAGATVGSLPGQLQEQGQFIKDNIDTLTPEDTMKLLAGSTLAASTDFLPMMAFMGRFSKKGVDAARAVDSFGKRLLKETAKGFAAEGGQEAGQAFITRASQKWVDENVGLLTDDALQDYAMNFLAGGFIGGGIGAAGEVGTTGARKAVDVFREGIKSFDAWRNTRQAPKVNPSSPTDGVSSAVAAAEASGRKINPVAAQVAASGGGSVFDSRMRDAEIGTMATEIESLVRDYNTAQSEPLFKIDSTMRSISPDPFVSMISGFALEGVPRTVQNAAGTTVVNPDLQMYLPGMQAIAKAMRNGLNSDTITDADMREIESLRDAVPDPKRIDSLVGFAATRPTLNAAMLSAIDARLEASRQEAADASGNMDIRLRDDGSASIVLPENREDPSAVNPRLDAMADPNDAGDAETDYQVGRNIVSARSVGNENTPAQRADAVAAVFGTKNPRPPEKVFFSDDYGPATQQALAAMPDPAAAQDELATLEDLIVAMNNAAPAERQRLQNAVARMVKKPVLQELYAAVKTRAMAEADAAAANDLTDGTGILFEKNPAKPGPYFERVKTEDGALYAPNKDDSAAIDLGILYRRWRQLDGEQDAQDPRAQLTAAIGAALSMPELNLDPNRIPWGKTLRFKDGQTIKMPFKKDLVLAQKKFDKLSPAEQAAEIARRQRVLSLISPRQGNTDPLDTPETLAGDDPFGENAGMSDLATPGSEPGVVVRELEQPTSGTGLVEDAPGTKANLNVSNKAIKLRSAVENDAPFAVYGEEFLALGVPDAKKISRDGPWLRFYATISGSEVIASMPEGEFAEKAPTIFASMQQGDNAAARPAQFGNKPNVFLMPDKVHTQADIDAFTMNLLAAELEASRPEIDDRSFNVELRKITELSDEALDAAFNRAVLGDFDPRMRVSEEGSATFKKEYVQEDAAADEADAKRALIAAKKAVARARRENTKLATAESKQAVKAALAEKRALENEIAAAKAESVTVQQLQAQVTARRTALNIARSDARAKDVSDAEQAKLAAAVATAEARLLDANAALNKALKDTGATPDTGRVAMRDKDAPAPALPKKRFNRDDFQDLVWNALTLKANAAARVRNDELTTDPVRTAAVPASRNARLAGRPGGKILRKRQVPGAPAEPENTAMADALKAAQAEKAKADAEAATARVAEIKARKPTKQPAVQPQPTALEVQAAMRATRTAAPADNAVRDVTGQVQPSPETDAAADAAAAAANPTASRQAKPAAPLGVNNVAATASAGEKTANQTFEIVKPEKADVSGMRFKGKNITNTKPNEPGWLGNPFVANDVDPNSKYTRGKATEAFEKVFLDRIAKDPGFKEAVLALRGKKIGYYKPDEKQIHLHVVQKWLSDQATIKTPAKAAIVKKLRALKGTLQTKRAEEALDQLLAGGIEAENGQYIEFTNSGLADGLALATRISDGWRTYPANGTRKEQDAWFFEKASQNIPQPAAIADYVQSLYQAGVAKIRYGDAAPKKAADVSGKPFMPGVIADWTVNRKVEDDVTSMQNLCLHTSSETVWKLQAHGYRATVAHAGVTVPGSDPSAPRMDHFAALVVIDGQEFVVDQPQNELFDPTGDGDNVRILQRTYTPRFIPKSQWAAEYNTPDAEFSAPANKPPEALPLDGVTIRAVPAAAPKAEYKIQRVKSYTPELVAANPTTLYVFGDNAKRYGKKGQAIIRGAPNAFGIATKDAWDEFMSDANFARNKATIDADIAAIKTAMDNGAYKTLAFPTDGVGTGLAQLSVKAPKTAAYLNAQLKAQLGVDNVVAAPAPVKRTAIVPAAIVRAYIEANPTAPRNNSAAIWDWYEKNQPKAAGSDTDFTPFDGTLAEQTAHIRKTLRKKFGGKVIDAMEKSGLLSVISREQALRLAPAMDGALAFASNGKVYIIAEQAPADPAQLAGLLVHEAVHAWLPSMLGKREFTRLTENHLQVAIKQMGSLPGASRLSYRELANHPVWRLYGLQRMRGRMYSQNPDGSFYIDDNKLQSADEALAYQVQYDRARFEQLPWLQRLITRVANMIRMALWKHRMQSPSQYQASIDAMYDNPDFLQHMAAQSIYEMVRRLGDGTTPEQIVKEATAIGEGMFWYSGHDMNAGLADAADARASGAAVDPNAKTGKTSAGNAPTVPGGATGSDAAAKLAKAALAGSGNYPLHLWQRDDFTAFVNKYLTPEHRKALFDLAHGQFASVWANSKSPAMQAAWTRMNATGAEGYEASLYYLLQAHMAGELTMDANEQKLLNAVTLGRRQLGLVTSQDLAMQILSDMKDGSLLDSVVKANPYQPERKLMQVNTKLAKLGNYVELATRRARMLFSNFMFNDYDRAERSGVPAFIELVDALAPRSGKYMLVDPETGTANHGVHMALAHENAKWLKALSDAVDGLTPEQQTRVLRELYYNQAAPRPSVSFTPAEAKAFADIRRVYEGLFEYAAKDGVFDPVKNRRKNYTPLMFDINGNVPQHKADLRRVFMQKGAANKSGYKYEALLDDLFVKLNPAEPGKTQIHFTSLSDTERGNFVDRVLENTFFDPADLLLDNQMGARFKFESPRIFQQIFDLAKETGDTADLDVLIGTLEPSLEQHGVRYVEPLVARTVEARLMPEKKFNALHQQMREQGASQDDLDAAERIYNAAFNRYKFPVLGPNGEKGSPTIAMLNRSLAVKMHNRSTLRTMQNIGAWQNLRLLPLALLSSLVDPGGLVIRSGGRFGASLMAMKDGLQGLVDKDMQAALVAAAESIGYSADLHAAMALQDGLAAGARTPFARRVNSWIFKVNMMEAWTRQTRLMAVQGANDFLVFHQRMYREGTAKQKATAQRMFAELGLQPDDVRIGEHGDGPLKGRPMVLVYTPAQAANANKEQLAADARVKAAMVKWVDEAILRPNNNQSPTWHKDPFTKLITQYKAFSYSIYEQLSRRAMREISEGNWGVLSAALVYLPVALMAELLRELIQWGPDGNPQRAQWGGVDYAQHAVVKTGLLGPTFDFQHGLVGDVERGGVIGRSFAGPSVGAALDVGAAATGNKDVGTVIESQMPLSALWKNWNNDPGGGGGGSRDPVAAAVPSN